VIQQDTITSGGKVKLQNKKILFSQEANSIALA
jgi:hypothetical protein